MAHSYKLAERSIPHDEVITRLGDEVERLVRALEDVDQCDPACLNVFGEFELQAIETSVRA